VAAYKRKASAGDGETLSSRVSETARNELASRRRHNLLTEMLREYEITEDPIDEAAVSRFMDLLA